MRGIKAARNRDSRGHRPWHQALPLHGKDFAAVVRGRSAVRVDLSNDAPYAQLLVSVSDAESAVAMIRGATGV